MFNQSYYLCGPEEGLGVSEGEGVKEEGLRDARLRRLFLEYDYFFSKKFAYNKNINYLCGPLRSRSNFRS